MRPSPRCLAPLVFLAAACGGNAPTVPDHPAGTNPPPTTVASVEVTPPSSTIGVGGSVPLSAVARTAGGQAVSGVTVQWTTGNPTLAVVAADGTVTGGAPGTADITATVSGISGHASVQITAPVGAVGSASIGAAGGFVTAQLTGGGSARLDVPAGALAALATFTITPKAAGPGQLHAFGLGPAGLQLVKQATLTLQLPPWETASPTKAVLRLVGTKQIFLPAALDVPGNKLIVRLTRLDAVAPAALRMPSGPGARVEDQEDLAIVDAAGAEIIAGAQTALAGFTPQASVNDINGVTDALSAAALLFNTLNLPDQNGLLASWRDKVCGFAAQAINRNAGLDLSSFEIADYERELELIIRWISAVAPLSDPSLGLPFSGCPAGTPPDPLDAMRAFTDKFIVRLKNIVEHTDIVARFDEILAERIPDLLDLDTDLALFGIGDKQGDLRTVDEAYFDRLRPEAYRQCRVGHDYGALAKLLLVEEQGNWRDLSRYALADLVGDAQQCGNDAQWKVLENGGTITVGRLGGGTTPGNPTLTGSTTLTGAQSLRFSGILHVLGCTDGNAPDVANHESLLFRARVGAATFTLGTVSAPSSFGPGNYFAPDPFTTTAADIRSKAGLAATTDATVSVEMVRMGNDCGSPMEAAMLGSEAVLGTVQLTIPADQCPNPAPAALSPGAALRGPGTRSAIVCGVLDITPTSLNLTVGQQGTFTARLNGVPLSNVVWTASGGAIDGIGRFSSQSTGDYTITATAVENSALSATATAHVSSGNGPPPPPPGANLSRSGTNPLLFTLRVVSLDLDEIRWFTSASTNTVGVGDLNQFVVKAFAGPTNVDQFTRIWTETVGFPALWIGGRTGYHVKIVVQACGFKNGVALKDALGNNLCARIETDL